MEINDAPTAWSDVDLENALPSDPRPWSALLFALAERCAAACVEFPSDLLGALLPKTHLCFVVRDKIRSLASNHFITLDHPRENGLGWNYDADAWNTFSRNVWPAMGYKPDDAIYPVGPAIVLAGHPMLPPAQHAPEMDLDASVYRTFLADCAFWLDKCRYVLATDYAESIGCHGISPYQTDYFRDTYSESLAALVAGTQPEDLRGCSAISAVYSWHDDPAYRSYWSAVSSGYELYAVNRSTLPAVAVLVFAFESFGDPRTANRTYPMRTTYELAVSNTFFDYLGGVHARDNVESEIKAALHGSSWLDYDIDIETITGAVPAYDANNRIVGADFSNCVCAKHTETRRWDEPGTRYVVLSNSDTSSSGATNGYSIKSVRYSIFDSFGFCQAPGVSEFSAAVAGHGKTLLADLSNTPMPAINVSNYLPTGAEVMEAEIRISCHPNVVLDYHDAYKFKLGEES